MAYPSPCDTCEKVESCRKKLGCEAWRIRYYYRQKQMNAYSRRAMRPQIVSGRSVFVYEHPDKIRRYLKYGPCKGCNAEEVCDTPCPAYLRWWDARMEWIKQGRGVELK